MEYKENKVKHVIGMHGNYLGDEEIQKEEWREGRQYKRRMRKIKV